MGGRREEKPLKRKEKQHGKKGKEERELATEGLTAGQGLSNLHILTSQHPLQEEPQSPLRRRGDSKARSKRCGLTEGALRPLLTLGFPLLSPFSFSAGSSLGPDFWQEVCENSSCRFTQLGAATVKGRGAWRAVSI